MTRPNYIISWYIITGDVKMKTKAESRERRRASLQDVETAILEGKWKTKHLTVMSLIKSLGLSNIGSCIYWKISAYAYFPKGNRHERLFSHRSLFLNNPYLEKQKFRSIWPTKMVRLLIFQAIWIGAYIPGKSECKAHVSILPMWAYFWIWAYFAVNIPIHRYWSLPTCRYFGYFSM